MSCVKVKKQAVFEVKLKQTGVPAMCREKSSRVSMLKEKLHTASHTRKVCVVKLLKTKHAQQHPQFTLHEPKVWIVANFHHLWRRWAPNVKPRHTEVRWLSRWKVLNRCFELSEEICQYMESKGRDATELWHEKWQGELGFLCNIMKHLKALNLRLRERDGVSIDMYAAVGALKMWEKRETLVSSCVLPINDKTGLYCNICYKWTFCWKKLTMHSTWRFARGDLPRKVSFTFSASHSGKSTYKHLNQTDQTPV